MKRLKDLAATVAAWKERVAIIILGQTFNSCFDFVFNYPIYLFVIEKKGVFEGYVWLTIIDFVICRIFLWIYDWSKKDWLGIELMKELGECGPSWIKKLSIKSRIGRILWWPFSKFSVFLFWIVRKGRVSAFLALSLFTDPFITTAYLRRGYGKYNGMSSKDYLVFVVSGLLGNAWWTARSFGILEVAKAILEKI